MGLERSCSNAVGIPSLQVIQSVPDPAMVSGVRRGTIGLPAKHKYDQGRCCDQTKFHGFLLILGGNFPQIKRSHYLTDYPIKLTVKLMNKFCDVLILSLEEEINDLTVEVDNQFFMAENAIQLVLEKLFQTKQFILERGFSTVEEEIYFFKILKPKILSKLIYYNAIYKIETKKPYGGNKVIKKYLHNELSKLRRYFDNNREFYKYFRTNSTYLDHKYFVRGKHDIKLSLDTYYFESDHSFSTSHDYKVAKILANDLVQVYLEDQLFDMNQKHRPSLGSNLNWTSSKTALIELIYALYAQGVFDNGNTDIKVIANTFENMFGIDLGDFYHTFLELRNRKTNRTKFLDSLRESIIRKMDEQDEK